MGIFSGGGGPQGAAGGDLTGVYPNPTIGALKVTNAKVSATAAIDLSKLAATGYLGYVNLQDQKSANTAGGTFTSGSYQTRVLNTEVTDTNADCTLSANQITLVAGTYECAITCPASVVNAHKGRLQNVTDASTVLLGTSEFSALSDAFQTCSLIRGRFTIAASKALEVQHRCGTTRATSGFGLASNFGDTEVYVVAEFWRVS